MVNSNTKRALLATTVIAGMAYATPVFAQVAPTPADPQEQAANLPPQKESADTKAQAPRAPADEIVITGTISRNPAAATASPVVSVTADDIQKRGISTVTEYLQTMTANNAGTVPPSWSAFGFTTGASAPSLRGFNDAYTLVLFDNMRTAVYPLADDTQRNIVDINTIPNSIVARIDTLLDGASSTYGSDAIAGVVNVITKTEIQGIHGNASYGFSQKGDAKERRFSLAGGVGRLSEDGYNIYADVEYQKNDPLYVRQRGYPFNSADLSQICGTADQGCLNNGIRNGIQADGTNLGFSSTQSVAVRPLNPTTLANAGRYQYLNGCVAPTTAVQLTGSQIIANTPANGIVCQQDLVNQYQMYNAQITRKGGTLRATKRFGDTEAFIMLNYYNTQTYNSGTPESFTSSTTPAGRRVSVSRIILPVYVCPGAVGVVGTNPATGNISGDLTFTGCNATNGTLNPNNPFAAAGQPGLLTGLTNQPTVTTTNARTYRVMSGIHGTFSGFDYNIGATASRVDLDIHNRGYINLRNLISAIGTGAYNFVDQNANSQAVMDSVFRPVDKTATSKLWQVQAAVGRDIFRLPGGDANVTVGGQYRHEALNNPSANPTNDVDPYARYYGINAVGVKGARDVWSLSYEVSAPILEQLRVKASGSYDHYSTGQKAFSPKFEAEFKPVDMLKLRGTWSKGFRAPNFNESFQLPATGYTSASIVCTQPQYAAFCAAHASNPSYYSGVYSYGLTSAGNPSLKPEKSKSYTLGTVFQPRRNITFTLDYWHTKISNLISPPAATADIFAQYYANGGVVNAPGVVVLPGTPDPQNPNALPLLGFIQSPFQNVNSFMGKGIDFSGDVRFPIRGDISWHSQMNVSYLMRLQKQYDDGTIERYDGTLGPCGWTSCSGSPKLRAIWQNTLNFGDRANFTLTANYSQGYSPTATDSGGFYKDCQASADSGQLVSYDNGDPVQCHVKASWWLDAHAEFKVIPAVTLYGDVLNLTNKKPPLDVNAAYSIYQFNPAWSDRLFIGRYFRIGARVDIDAPHRVVASYVAPVAPPPPPAPATITCPDGLVILANQQCPVPPAPPAPPAPAPERGL